MPAVPVTALGLSVGPVTSLRREVECDVSAPIGVRVVQGPLRWLRGHVVAIVVDVLVLLVLVALVRSVVGLTLEVFTLVVSSDSEAFKAVTTQVLTVFVFIEIFHSLIDYLENQRVRITHLADASLAFVLRETWIALYSGEVGWGHIVALAVLVLALGVVRTMAVVYSPAAEIAD